MIKWFLCGKSRKCDYCDAWTKVGDRMWYNTESKETFCERCHARIEYMQTRNVSKANEEEIRESFWWRESMY
jgi:hypothetical protein